MRVQAGAGFAGWGGGLGGGMDGGEVEGGKEGEGGGVVGKCVRGFVPVDGGVNGCEMR